MEMMKDTEQRGSHRDRFGAFVKSAFSYPRKLWGMRPVTAVSIVISTMLFAILDFIDADILFHIALAVLYFAIFVLCLESIRIQKSIFLKNILFVFFGILSGVMSFFNYDDLGVFRKHRIWTTHDQCKITIDIHGKTDIINVS